MQMMRVLAGFAVLLVTVQLCHAAEISDGWVSVDPGGGGLRVSISFTADGQHGWNVGICNIGHTSNAGRTWSSQWAADRPAYWFNNVVAISDKVAVVSGFAYGRNAGGVVLRTVDGGANWLPVKVGTREDAGFGSLAFTPDRKVGFVISNQEGLFCTRDGGVSWQAGNVGASCERSWVATRGVIAAPNNTTVLVGCDGAIARSVDAGATWSLLPFPPGKGKMLQAVIAADARRCWVEILGEGTYETTNGGAAWGPSKLAGAAVFQDKTNGWATRGMDILHTSDGGMTWTDATRVGGAQSRLVNLFCTKTRVWVVGGDEGWGRSFMSSRPLPGVSVPSAPTGVIPITFTMPQKGFASIQILNEQDEVVENLVSGQEFTAGQNTVWWNLATLDDFWQPLAKTNMWQYSPPDNTPKVASAGKYHWRGIWHPGLSLEYQYAYYPVKKHGVAWTTPDGAGGWLGDHAPPTDVIRTGETMWLGAFCEGGNGILESDLDMQKRWGSGAIELANPHVFAADGEFLYFIDQNGWLGFGGQRLAVVRMNRKTREAHRILAVAANQTAITKPAPADQKPGSPTELIAVEGMAVIGDRLWLADRAANLVWVCDIGPNLAGKDQNVHVLRQIAVDRPGRMRPYSGGRLAVTCKTGVVLIDSKTSAVTPAVTGCTNPLGLATDADGNFHVGEMEPVHQVKVFSPTGKLVRSIGKPGIHRVGPFDADNLESPAGIDVDAKGNVWVCEATSEMRRTSVWDRDGHCVNQVLGSTIYGGGAAGIDPVDANHLFARGLELRRDPKTAVVTPVNLLWRGDDSTYDSFAQGGQGFDDQVPAHPFWKGGKLYFRMWNSARVSTIWVMDRDHLRPVAACGKTPAWLRERCNRAKAASADKDGIFAWTDRNGDGKVQAEEASFGDLVTDGAIWHVLPNENFDVTFSSVSGPVGMGFFRAQSTTPEGYPLYTIPKAYVNVPNLSVNDPVQVQTCYTDSKGNGIGVCPYIFSLSPSGKVNWRYKSRWPGLHGGLSTSADGSQPGVLIATMRTYGAAVASEEIGEVICFGSNYGASDLLTCEEGLYIGRTFLDCRRGDAWSYNQPPTPAQLSQVSLGQEAFGGSFQRTVDEAGKAHFRYVVSPGGPSCSVIELKGLEDVKRLPGGAFEVTPQHMVEADRLRQRQALQAKEDKTYVIGRMKAVTVDGKAEEWPPEKQRIDGFALGYDDANLYVLFEGSDDRAVFTNASTQTDWKEAFVHGDVVDVMLQTRPGADPRRENAAQGDIRLSFAMVDGKPSAILYDYVVPGTAPSAREAFSSPTGSVSVDSVKILTDARIAITRRSNSYTLEAAVPLAALHLTPKAGLSLAGDVGRVMSDQTGTTRVDRQYWSNRNTRTVKDVPSEIRLQPNLWGQFTFGE